MPGQKQNFGFITDFAHHVGLWSLNHFETAKGTLAPSPIARVIGCGCAESRTSPAVGPCCSSKNRSSETFWVAYPGTKIYGVSVPQKESLIFILDPSVSREAVWRWRSLVPIITFIELAAVMDPMQWSILNYLFSAKYHIHFKAIVIEAVFCKVNIHQPIFAQFNKEVHGKQDRIYIHRILHKSTQNVQNVQSKCLTSCDFCNGETRHATTTLQLRETSKKSWNDEGAASQSLKVQLWYKLPWQNSLTPPGKCLVQFPWFAV